MVNHTPPRAMDAAVARGTYLRAVGALFIAGMATFMTLYSAQPILPMLSEAFQISSGQASWAMSATTLGLGAGLLVAGPLSDATGRTWLIHASLLASAALGLASALAPNWSTLVVLRFALGIALAGLPAAASSYLREEVAGVGMGRAAGLYIGGTALGGMSGRLIGGGLAQVSTWQGTLAGIGLAGLLGAIVVRLMLPRSAKFVPSSRAPRDLALATKNALTDTQLLVLYTVGLLACGSLAALLNAVSFRLAAEPFTLGPGVASLVFLVYPIGSVTSAMGGRISERLGPAPTVATGAAVAVVGVLLTAPESMVWTVIGLAVYIAGFFVVHGVTTGWVPIHAHARGGSTAQAASLYLVFFYVGATIFGSASGVAWSSHGWPGVIAVSGGCMALLCVLVLSTSRRPRP